MKDSLSKVQSLMIRLHMDAVLVSSIPNIIYLTGFSHFSQHEREAFLLITKNKNYILTDGRYSEAVKNNINDFDLIEISSKRTFEKTLKDLARKNKIRRVGFDHHNITVAEHKKLSRVFKNLKHFSIDNLRIIKDKSEINAIEKACDLGDKTFKHILNKIKPGVTEKELAFEIEFFIKKDGADLSFPPIVAFGKNSSIPHHKPSDQRLKTKDIILLDFGAKLNNYCSDMTRTVFLGSANAEYKKIYKTVLEAQKIAIEQFNNLTMKQFEKNIKASEIDKAARDYITSKGYPTIPHSLGHGIGLEVHESPRLSPKSKDVLKPGMVFTIEPGIYIPGLGGIRIEDVVVLEKSGLPRRKAGPRLLTYSPKQIIEL